MYSAKEKLHHFRQLSSPLAAEADLALLHEKNPLSTDFARFDLAPCKNAEDILFALLDVAEHDDIVRNRREFLADSENPDTDGGSENPNPNTDDGSENPNPDTDGGSENPNPDADGGSENPNPDTDGGSENPNINESEVPDINFPGFKEKENEAQDGSESQTIDDTPAVDSIEKKEQQTESVSSPLPSEGKGEAPRKKKKKNTPK